MAKQVLITPFLTNKVCHGTPKQWCRCKIMYIPDLILVRNQCTVWCIRLCAAFLIASINYFFGHLYSTVRSV